MTSKTDQLTRETQRWLQIEQIFHQTLRCPEEDRGTYLRRICSGDQELFGEVVSLVSSYEQSGEFLEKPPVTKALNLLRTEDPELHSQATIGSYVVEQRIGRGGMGDVYLVCDQRLGRQVALKVLPKSFARQSDWVSRFEQEARAASSVAHPHIAHIYEVGESDGRHYIAMEYVRGVTLRAHLQAGRPELAAALGIVTQIARALVAAHAAGVLHRDIKPANIMIRSDGYVKVLDFGLAGSARAGSDGSRGGFALRLVDTEPGVIMGSPGYMSPEQARGQEVDARSDLWSLGVIFYELLTETNPFLRETSSDTMAAILQTTPLPPSVLAPGLPEQIEGIVLKLLAKGREQRYQTAETLLADLSRASEQLKVREAHENNVNDSGSPAGSARRVTGEQARQTQAHSAVSFASLTKFVAHRGAIYIMLLALLAIGALVALKVATYSPPAAPVIPITSIAVLPLAPEDGAAASEYLADGLSESLIERLSRLTRLKVIARNSSFKYKGKSVPPADIAKELGVQALVMGSVAQAGDELLIKIELVDGGGAKQLWSRNYQNQTSDVPLVLNDISKQIAGQLNLDLSAAELDLTSGGEKPSGNAYEHYLKGRFYWKQLTEESLEKSIRAFNEALEIDPQYALAYAGLANSYATLGANFQAPEKTFPKAELCAQKALQLNDALPEAHYAMAVTRYLYNWDLAGARKELERALELNPNYAAANSLFCLLNLSQGDIKEATRYIQKALARDPLSLIFELHLTYIYYCQKENHRALDELQKMLQQEPAAPFLYNELARVYAQMGMFSEALAASQRATIVMGQDPETLCSLGIVYALAGKRREAVWVAGTLQNLSQQRYVQAYLVASIYGALDQRDETFKWLAKANQQHSAQLLRIKVDPNFDKIRSDRRYLELIQSMHLG
jgi:serine/threonine protein kinase/TolB-like protein/Tfp pilus assembly protein PilF